MRFNASADRGSSPYSHMA